MRWWFKQHEGMPNQPPKVCGISRTTLRSIRIKTMHETYFLFFSFFFFFFLLLLFFFSSPGNREKDWPMPTPGGSAILQPPFNIAL